MSRCLMWASSWATTPRTSLRSSTCSRPCVTHTSAVFSLRPVANAFGCMSAEMNSRGVCMLPRAASASRSARSQSSSPGCTSRARAARTASLSLIQYELPTITRPSARPMIVPVGPPSSEPMSTMNPPSPASRVKVLTVFLNMAPLREWDRFEWNGEWSASGPAVSRPGGGCGVAVDRSSSEVEDLGQEVLALLGPVAVAVAVAVASERRRSSSSSSSQSRRRSAYRGSVYLASPPRWSGYGDGAGATGAGIGARGGGGIEPAPSAWSISLSSSPRSSQTPLQLGHQSISTPERLTTWRVVASKGQSTMGSFQQTVDSFAEGLPALAGLAPPVAAPGAWPGPDNVLTTDLVGYSPSVG